MSTSHLSPLLLSSLEMMQHAIEHLEKGTEKDRGFAVLHADNSVELILKELVRIKGIRVINRKGYSMDYYECVDRLAEAGLKIPELPSIDLLHTERNSVYHLGNKLDKNKAEWLIYDVALGFVKRMCSDELGLDVNSFPKEFNLSPKIVQDIKLTRNGVVNQYLIEAEHSLKLGEFNNTVMASYIGIEALFREYIFAKSGHPQMNVKAIIENNAPRDLVIKFEMLRQMRNSVAHAMVQTNENDAKLALEVFTRIIDEIGLPLELKCKTCGVQFRSGIVMSRKVFETAIIEANKHQCPNGHLHSYDKGNYIVRL